MNYSYNFLNILIVVRQCVFQPANLRCDPAPVHLIQMNGSLSDFSRAR